MVRVYFNLHKKNFTIQYKTEKGWRKMSSATYVELSNTTFKVYETSRQRVVKEKKKNVHAFVCGDLIYYDHSATTDTSMLAKHSEVKYNPYRCGFFHYKNGNRAKDGCRLILMNRQILALGI